MTDEDEIRNFVEQTADLRFSVRAEGLREILRARGHDPNRTIQHGCDQGDDVHIDLVLEDGSPVSLDYREHYQTRQAITITEWDIEDYSDRAIELAREIIQGDTTEFDRQVRAFFESELQSKDAPLPPLEWGDRPWHTWEAKPEEQTGENKRMESNG